MRLKKGGERNQESWAREMGEEWGEGRSRLCCTFSPGARCADVLPSTSLQQWPRGGEGGEVPLPQPLSFLSRQILREKHKSERGEEKKVPPSSSYSSSHWASPPPAATVSLGFLKKKSSAAGERGGKRALGEEGKRKRKLRGRSSLFARFLAHARGKRERERGGKRQKEDLEFKASLGETPLGLSLFETEKHYHGERTMGILCVFLCLSHFCTTIAEK